MHEAQADRGAKHRFDEVASQVQFDRLKVRRNKKTFIQALLLCFSYHDYFALVFIQ